MNCALLRKNTAGMDVEVHEEGVAGGEGIRRLDVIGESSGKNSLFTKHGRGIEIKCTTLKRILERTPCDFLKIDVEGAEYEILYAAAPVLSRVKTIMMEVHGVEGETFQELEVFLERQGFKVSRLSGSIFKAQRRSEGLV